jgi:excisionase family DNA binding protein
MTTLFTRREAATALRLGRSSTDKLIANGTVKVVRLGRRVLIPASEIDRLTATAS